MLTFCELVIGGEEAHQPLAAQLLTEHVYAGAVIPVAGERVHLWWWPGGSHFEQEQQPGDAEGLGLAVLKFGDRPSVGAVGSGT